MPYDRTKEFIEIEKMLIEVRRQCNRLQIPFFWLAAVRDDGNSTDYMVALDENETVNDNSQNYRCNALVPGSMGVSLASDLIRDMVLVLNGFVVVPSENPIANISAGDLSLEALFPKVKGYVPDGDGGMVYTDLLTDDDGEEMAIASTEPKPERVPVKPLQPDTGRSSSGENVFVPISVDLEPENKSKAAELNLSFNMGNTSDSE